MTKRDLPFLKHLFQQASDGIRSLGDTFEVQTKPGRGNYVTEADFLSEKILKEEIGRAFPHDRILSEETASETEGALEEKYVWVIDPIDGTNNFRFGRNYSCISIGLAHKGEVILGGVYNFYSDDLYHAEKGKGSYYNSTPIHVQEQKDISNITLGTGNSSDPEVTKSELEIITQIEPVPRVYIRGSAALELSEVAAGKMDAYFHSNIHPWDIAAAVVIIREAGGVFKNYTGENATILDSQILAGSSRVVELLLPYFKS